MDIEKFMQAEIKVIVQNFNHPTYHQLFGKFEPFMSITDLLFNHAHASLRIIREKG